MRIPAEHRRREHAVTSWAFVIGAVLLMMLLEGGVEWLAGRMPW